MKAMYRAALMVAAFVFLLPLSARSEIKAGSFEVTPFGGYNLFENDQNLKNRPVYGGRLGYNFTKHIGIEGAVEFIHSRVDDRAITDTKEGQFGYPMDKVKLTFYHLDAVYHFMPDGKFNPFVLAGFGGAHYSPEISTKDVMAAFNVGVGAKYWVADRIALRFDVRDYMVTEIFQETYHNVGATFGITFAFGGKTKPAPALVAKPEPKPVTEAKPIPKAEDTTAPKVVCTSPDSGVTGVAIDRNVIATFSEEMDRSTIDTSTFTVKRGTTPVSGKVTLAGINATFNPSSDLEKGATYTATIAAGVKDLSGNALANSYVWSFTTIPAPKIVPAVLITLEDSHFLFDSSELHENGKTILNYNAKILKENPKMQIRIAGYASASGTEEYNQKLSERRATAVKEYLIKEGGIDRGRLTKIGYGETRPAEYEPVPSDIYSEAAKANMRVLFEIIVK